MTAPPEKKHARRPWRDNIEALVMAIVMAVMLKYFIVEAYQIPTGSMQPTLMGNDEAGIKDRIIVDKLSFHFRDPERFEVVVFRYPLDRSKSFIKRICGMPGEELRIALGDLWTRKGPDEEWKVVRRPLPVQREVWKRLYPKDPRYSSWRIESGAKSWAIQGRDRIQARGEGTVRLPNDGGSVIDDYRDGYPGNMGDTLSRVRVVPSGHPVGDLRIEGEVRALAGCKSVAAVLREGRRKYVFELPGPAAPDGESPRIRTEGVEALEPLAPAAKAKVPYRLPAGKSVSFAAQNMDDLLVLEVDGERIAQVEIPSASDQASGCELAVQGEGADFTSLELYRDIFYLEDNQHSEFRIPDGCYVMLGDNTQDSSDSRFWTLTTMGPGDDGKPVRGNYFPPQNPIQMPGDPQGPRIFIRDEWGDLHTFISKESPNANLEWAPFVRRDMILGRAVAVFWPISFAHRVWRLQWVH